MQNCPINSKQVQYAQAIILEKQFARTSTQILIKILVPLYHWRMGILAQNRKKETDTTQQYQMGKKVAYSPFVRIKNPTFSIIEDVKK